MLTYGLLTDFDVNNDLVYHRNLSVIVSLIVAYVLFRVLTRRLKKINSNSSEINEIGKK